MAILNAANYPAPSAPDTGDLFCIYSGADSDTALMTKAQLFDLSGEGTLQIILPLSNDPVTPSLSIGGTGEGLYQSTNGSIDFAIGGAKTMYLWSQGLHFTTGAIIRNTGPDATTPNFCPFSTDSTTGVGGVVGTLSLITGGVEAINVDASQVVSVADKFVLPTAKFIEFGTSSIAGVVGAEGAAGYLKLYANGQSKFEIDSDGRVLTNNLNLNDATGNEAAFTLNYTTNKATSGDDTGLVVNQTDTASPGSSYLQQWQKGGAVQALMSNDGGFRARNLQVNDASNFRLSGKASPASMTVGGVVQVGDINGTQGERGLETAELYVSRTDTLSSGTFYSTQILPTLNQSGTAAATDLLVNRTETAVGSGAQLLIDAQVGGVSKFSVDNAGVTLVPNGTAGAPSYSFASFPTYGIYFDAATGLVVSHAGAAIFGTSTGRLQMRADTFVTNDVNSGLTASTTQTQGQGALSTSINEVSTVANTNDTVTLPVAFAGTEVTIINNGANTLQIFPASGDNLGAGVDTATTLAAGSNVRYVAYDGTNWEVI